MIQAMLEGAYTFAKLHHVRMGFSAEMDEVGKFRFRKLFHLLKLIVETYYVALTHQVRILYYPPAGPELVPVLRDILYLLSVRWLFRTRIFQFHAAGLSEFYHKSPGFLRLFMRAAYFDPEMTIRSSRLTSRDGQVLRAKRDLVIPLGIPDYGCLAPGPRPASASPPTILHVGVLREDKGILVLLEAFKRIRLSGKAACLDLVGRFASTAFEREVLEFISTNNLGEVVRLRGVLTGDDKWLAFSEADLFCFPTHHPSETFGVCLLEAMSFTLPTVATRWGGIPDIVDDGETGFLVPIRDAVAMAEKLERLVLDRGLREAMGRAGREKFRREFTLEQYHARMNMMFQAVQADARQKKARLF
jgi:glycosyltransferase involved in cell wall biosynthesis